MQKILSMLMLMTMLILSSCDKEDDGGSNSGGGDSFECEIDGTAHKISGKFAFAQKVDAEVFAIYGSEDQTKSGFKNVYISMKSVPAKGVYDLSKSDVGSGNILETSSGTLYNSNFPGGSGTLEVTEKTDNRIKGSFSFVGATGQGAKKTVTKGKFDVSIK